MKLWCFWSWHGAVMKLWHFWSWVQLLNIWLSLLGSFIDFSLDLLYLLLIISLINLLNIPSLCSCFTAVAKMCVCACVRACMRARVCASHYITLRCFTDIYVMDLCWPRSSKAQKTLWPKSQSCWTPPWRQSVGKIGCIPRCPWEVSQLVEQHPTYCGEVCSRWCPRICDRERQRRLQSNPPRMTSSVVILWWRSGRLTDDSQPADNLCFLLSPGTTTGRWEEM